MRVGVPQVEARQRDEDAAGYRLLSSGRGVRSAFLGYCRDCYGRDRGWRLCSCRELELPERGRRRCLSLSWRLAGLAGACCGALGVLPVEPPHLRTPL